MPLDVEAIRPERDDDFWREIVYKDGKLDEEAVLNELADYRFLMAQVSDVYCHITGGRMSKPMHYAKDVIAQHDEIAAKERDEAFNEGKETGREEAEAELTAARAFLADALAEAERGHAIERAAKAVVEADAAFEVAWNLPLRDGRRPDLFWSASDRLTAATKALRAALEGKANA